MKCFQVVNVRERLVYEQTASPSFLLECLVSLEYDTSMSEHLILILKFYSMFGFTNKTKESQSHDSKSGLYR